ncbi:hypothetical protein HU200_065325 [Digitaria exilis]|uniref:Uncharacterized protein n=1 Tax=Digitaria exilis TaxID=1010633 RepID=A0A835A0J4_9POAL|nr:hypothetical protein HU200_065325 [Digitaria exilis]
MKSRASLRRTPLCSCAGVEIEESGEVAELVKETTAGQLESLELKLSGKVRYRSVHLGTYTLRDLPVAAADNGAGD